MNANNQTNGTLISDNEPQTLTIEKVRSCKGLEHLTEAQALHIIQSLTVLCQIAVKAATSNAA